MGDPLASELLCLFLATLYRLSCTPPWSDIVINMIVAARDRLYILIPDHFACYVFIAESEIAPQPPSLLAHTNCSRFVQHDEQIIPQMPVLLSRRLEYVCAPQGQPSRRGGQLFVSLVSQLGLMFTVARILACSPAIIYCSVASQAMPGVRTLGSDLQNPEKTTMT